MDQADLKYTSEEWRIPAIDGHGHSVRGYYRISPAMERAIGIVFQSKKFPYKTTQDLVRHAIYRHLGFLHRKEDISLHHMAGLEAANDLIREDMYRTEMEETFVELAARIDIHYGRGDMREVFRLLTTVKSKLRSLEPSAWKDRYQRSFARRFQGILSGSQLPAKQTPADRTPADRTPELITAPALEAPTQKLITAPVPENPTVGHAYGIRQQIDAARERKRIATQGDEGDGKDKD